MAATIYTGPGKVSFNSKVLVAEGAGGAVSARLNQETVPVAGAFYGQVKNLLRDATVEINISPFDDWSLLPTLFPFQVVTCNATPGTLKIGDRPHGATFATHKPCTIWTPDQRLYTFPRSAITRHPSLSLAIDRPFYSGTTITAINAFSAGTTLIAMGAAGFLMSLVESGGAEPTPAIDAANIIRGSWTGVWATHTGFTTAVEGEDGWTLDCDARYSTHKCQGRTLAMTLDSVSFMARCRPFGPTHTELLALIEDAAHGEELTDANDLVLTGPSSKLITLKKAKIVGAGYDFGGTSLGTGEVGFVNSLSTTVPGTPDPLVIFSA